MREKTAPGSMPVPANYMNAQSAMIGLRGRDLFSTLRTLAFQGLRQPVHSARHALAFGKQLGRVMLGEMLQDLFDIMAVNPRQAFHAREQKRDIIALQPHQQ